MHVGLADVEAALRTVQRILDRLTAAGDDEDAFELAKAQYAASLRNSWPGNLSSLAGALSGLLANPKAMALLGGEDGEDAKAIEDAIATFREVRHN